MREPETQETARKNGVVSLSCQLGRPHPHHAQQQAGEATPGGHDEGGMTTGTECQDRGDGRSQDQGHSV